MMLLSYRDIRLHSFSIFIPQNKRMFAIAIDIPDHGIIYESESTLNVFCSQCLKLSQRLMRPMRLSDI